MGCFISKNKQTLNNTSRNSEPKFIEFDSNDTIRSDQSVCMSPNSQIYNDTNSDILL